MGNSKINYFYDLLGLTKESTVDEIRRKYLELSKMYHPDKFINFSKEEYNAAEEKFKLISEAYNELISHAEGQGTVSTSENYEMPTIKLARILYNKALIFYKQGDINNALDASLSAYRQDENVPEYLRLIVKCLLTKDRRLHEAKEYCMKLIKIEYYYSENFYIMGLIYKKAGFNEIASTYFQKAKQMGYDSNLVNAQLDEVNPKSFKNKIKNIFKKYT